MSKGTHATVLFVDSLKDKRWEAKIVEQSGNKVKLSVNSPASAVCGQYGLTVTCGSIKGETTTTHHCSKNIIMLFNPWCEGELGRGCRHGSQRMQGGGRREDSDKRRKEWYCVSGFITEIFLL